MNQRREWEMDEQIDILHRGEDPPAARDAEGEELLAVVQAIRGLEPDDVDVGDGHSRREGYPGVLRRLPKVQAIAGFIAVLVIALVMWAVLGPGLGAVQAWAIPQGRIMALDPGTGQIDQEWVLADAMLPGPAPAHHRWLLMQGYSKDEERHIYFVFDLEFGQRSPLTFSEMPDLGPYMEDPQSTTGPITWRGTWLEDDHLLLYTRNAVVVVDVSSMELVAARNFDVDLWSWLGDGGLGGITPAADGDTFIAVLGQGPGGISLAVLDRHLTTERWITPVDVQLADLMEGLNMLQVRDRGDGTVIVAERSLGEMEAKHRSFLVNLATGEVKTILETFPGPDWNADGSMAHIRGWYVYDATGSRLMEFEAIGVLEAAWSPDGELLAVGDGTVWHAEQGVIAELPGERHHPASWSPDGTWLVTNEGILWNRESGSEGEIDIRDGRLRRFWWPEDWHRSLLGWDGAGRIIVHEGPASRLGP